VSRLPFAGPEEATLPFAGFRAAVSPANGSGDAQGCHLGRSDMRNGPDLVVRAALA